MKTLSTLLLVAMLASCNNIAGWFGSNTDSSQVRTDLESQQFARDLTITPANAYSDLFLDSTAVEKYLEQKSIQADLAQSIRNFYKVRNYQYAWFTSNGLTEQTRNFRHLKQQAEPVDRQDSIHKHIDSLLLNDSLFVQAHDSSVIHTELQLSADFVHYAKTHNDNPFFSGNNYYYAVPAKKTDALQMADSILHKQDSNKYAANKAYLALKGQLAKYYAAASKGQEDSLKVTAIKKGSSGAEVGVLKKKLALTGDLRLNDTSSSYTDSLTVAVKSFQQRHGLKPTGELNDSTLSELNRPAAERIQQILVNMDRVLWLPPVPDGNHIYVNIPSFMLYVYDSADSASIRMPVIVGKQGAHTFSFNDTITEIVFSPYWNVPESIVKNELMPKMKNDPAYLKKNNMEVTGEKDSIPQVRQLPGAKNELGRVKFLFPNSFDIYLHDTPDKGLFNKKDRALSHGCIRVADAARLAQYLLKDQKEWTDQRIKQAMNSGREERVKITRAVPVVIAYHTAWVDDRGGVNFRPDVYGHDARMRERLFTDGQTQAVAKR